MARRIVNRMDKRAEYEAYERRQEEEELEEDEEEEEDEDEEEDEEEEGLVDEEEEEDEEAPRKKKVDKEAKARPRTRTPKGAPRMKVVWGVFNNSNQRVATFDYPKRREADEYAAKLRAEKNQTFFVQPVKEPMEEKKE
jgi:hypothetical protein